MEAEPQELEAWNQFFSDRSAKVREVLIDRYMPFANMLAAKLYANRQIEEIEFDEFKQYALIGLIEAIDRYDPMHGASFKTFASYRIKGSVLTGIERYCEKQQQIAARTRMREERVQVLLVEAAEEADPFMRLVDLAIGVAIGYMLEDSGMYQTGNEFQEHHIYHSRELSDLASVVKRLVATLPEIEEKVIKDHYFQHIRFDHIAEEMQVSKSRVSQIHRQALKRLIDNYEELKLLRTDY